MPTLAEICPRSRASAILGLVALALLQVSLAAHQFEHSADHGYNVCDVCTAYSELDDAPVAAKASSDFPVAHTSSIGSLIESPAATLFVTAYRSRAPPLS